MKLKDKVIVITGSSRGTAKSVTAISVQVPGKKTGKVYSLTSGLRIIRGIMLIMYYRVSRKI